MALRMWEVFPGIAASVIGDWSARVPLASFASAALQATVASKHAKDQVNRSPCLASGVARARGKRDARAPVSSH